MCWTRLPSWTRRWETHRLRLAFYWLLNRFQIFQIHQVSSNYEIFSFQVYDFLKGRLQICLQHDLQNLKMECIFNLQFEGNILFLFSICAFWSRLASFFLIERSSHCATWVEWKRRAFSLKKFSNCVHTKENRRVTSFMPSFFQQRWVDDFWKELIQTWSKYLNVISFFWNR